MPCLNVQIETFPGALGRNTFDLSDLQLRRALFRPLVDSPGAPGYSLARLHPIDCKRIELVFDRSLPHINLGKQVLETACDQTAKILAQPDATARLFGVSAERLGTHRLALSTQVPTTLLSSYLEALPVLFENQGVTGTGTFRIDATTPESVTLCQQIGEPPYKVRLIVETDAKRILRAIDKGEIDLTSPGTFDVIPQGEGARNFLRTETNIHALLLINPRRVTALRSPAYRFALANEIQRPERLAHLLIRDAWPLPSTPMEAKLSRDDPPSLIYGNYYPNGAIADEVVKAIARLGSRAPQSAALSLADLSARLRKGEFDMALALSVENQTPNHALRLRLAATALDTFPIGPDRDRAAIRYRRIVGQTPDPETLGDILARVPVVPLFRFRSGVFSSSGLTIPPMIHGTVLALEQISIQEIIDAK